MKAHQQKKDTSTNNKTSIILTEEIKGCNELEDKSTLVTNTDSTKKNQDQIAATVEEEEEKKALQVANSKFYHSIYPKYKLLSHNSGPNNIPNPRDENKAFGTNKNAEQEQIDSRN